MAFIVERELEPIEPAEAVREYTYEDVDLGDESWNYRIWWNDRAERWNIDLWTSDGEKAIIGKRLVPNYPIGWANTGRKPSGGHLFLLDIGDETGDDACTYEGLGHRWRLSWVTGSPDPSTRPWTITVP